MDVRVTATGGRNGAIDWDIDGKKPKEARLDFAKDSGPHRIKFKLFDNTGRGLRFDDSGPFWAHETQSGDCPPANSTSGETRVVDCKDTSLFVDNKNSKDCTIQYQLNFVDSAGKREPVDPMIKNGGGQIV